MLLGVVAAAVGVATVGVAVLAVREQKVANRQQAQANAQQAEANQQQAQANQRQQEAAEEDRRASRTQAERENQRDTPPVSLWIEQPRPASPYADHRVVFHLENRSLTAITGFQVVLDVKDASGADGTTDGTVKLSASDTVPSCTAMTFTIPPQLKLASYDSDLDGKLIHLQDPVLTFSHADRAWQIRPGGTAIGEPAQGSQPGTFPGRRFLNAIPVGPVANVAVTPLACANTN